MHPGFLLIKSLRYLLGVITIMFGVSKEYIRRVYKICTDVYNFKNFKNICFIYNINQASVFMYGCLLTLDDLIRGLIIYTSQQPMCTEYY